MAAITRTVRLQKLRERFCDGARLSTRRICNDYQVCPKTARRDIQALEEMGLELIRDDVAAEQTWFAAVQSRQFRVTYSINDVIALLFGRRCFDFLKNTSLEDGLNRVYSQVESQLASMKDMERARQLHRKVHLIHEGPKVPGAHESEVLDECLSALLYECALLVTYRDAAGKRSRRRLYPLAITAYKRGLYLVAADEPGATSVPRVFALERIRKAQWLRKEPFDYPADFDPETFFSTAFLMVPGNQEPVTLVFDANSEPFVRVRQYHESQRLKKRPNGRLEMRMKVPVNFELVNFVLSFGPHVVVESPVSLKYQVTSALRQTLDQYNALPNPNKCSKI